MTTDPGPIIVTGSPRSGTTLMTKVLEQLGFFMGFNMNTQFEDWYFIKVNEHIMDRLGVTWDRPFPRKNETLDLDFVVQHIRQSEALNNKIPWGFKDPRTTIVRDQWDQIFNRLDMEPTWIRMQRHPMDMAVSLFSRENSKSRDHLEADRPQDRGLTSQGINIWPKVSRRAMKKKGALDLVREYNQAFCSKEYISISFEDLVRKPEFVLARLANKLSVKVSNWRVDHISDMMNPDRAFAYKDNPELVNFWETHQ